MTRRMRCKHVGLGVNHQVDAHPGAVGHAAPLLEFVRADAGDFDLDVRVRLGDQAGEQIDLVGVGDGDEHLRVSEAGLLQSANAGGATVDNFGVELLLELRAALGVLVDDGDLVALSNEAGCDERGALAAPGNQDAHEGCPEVFILSLSQPQGPQNPQCSSAELLGRSAVGQPNQSEDAHANDYAPHGTQARPMKMRPPRFKTLVPLVG